MDTLRCTLDTPVVQLLYAIVISVLKMLSGLFKRNKDVFIWLKKLKFKRKKRFCSRTFLDKKRLVINSIYDNKF